jgi:hypothetical protein
MWSTADEVETKFREATLSPGEAEDVAEYGFAWRTVASGTFDDGTQFVTIERVSVEDGRVRVGDRQEFMHYEAFADAASFVSTSFECATTTLEERLGPYGIEWEREQMERRGMVV